ncbi:MAG TPA: class I SAM-dependent methyltransferase [Gemmatimonadales bacterium]
MAHADQVIPAYDRIAAVWREERVAGSADFRERALLDRLVLPLPGGARILDVGCGPGEPIAAYLARRGFKVVGLDGSDRMLDLARQAVPQATFLPGDMRTADPGRPFDAIVAWDSVFHVPRADHHGIFARFHSWLRPAGRLLMSLGGSDEGGFTSQMHGETFFYSGHKPAEALRILASVGFRIEHWEMDDASSRGHIAVLGVRDAA